MTVGLAVVTQRTYGPWQEVGERVLTKALVIKLDGILAGENPPAGASIYHLKNTREIL